MRKYFFAYHEVNGIAFPFTWAEDDGLPIGGRPAFLDKKMVWEISHTEYCGDFLVLEKKHPLNLPNIKGPPMVPDNDLD